MRQTLLPGVQSLKRNDMPVWVLVFLVIHRHGLLYRQCSETPLPTVPRISRCLQFGGQREPRWVLCVTCRAKQKSITVITVCPTSKPTFYCLPDQHCSEKKVLSAAHGIKAVVVRVSISDGCSFRIMDGERILPKENQKEDFLQKLDEYR